MVKLSNIAGMMVEKLNIPDCSCDGVCDCDSSWIEGNNNALSQMGEREITHNREKLAQTICDSRYGEGAFIRWKEIKSPYANNLIEISYEDADAIITSLPTILEVKKEGEI